MTKTNFRSAALAVLALGAGLATSQAFAQNVYADPSVVQARPYVETDEVVVPPNVKGQFTCAFNESHTHLERQNCAGQHYRYGF